VCDTSQSASKHKASGRAGKNHAAALVMKFLVPVIDDDGVRWARKRSRMLVNCPLIKLQPRCCYYSARGCNIKRAARERVSERECVLSSPMKVVNQRQCARGSIAGPHSEMANENFRLECGGKAGSSE
jgi:hypothetical protein